MWKVCWGREMLTEEALAVDQAYGFCIRMEVRMESYI